MAALLELGSGFNPEFTGRENVFLNGSILGVSRKQMQDRFDDIAAFADIGEFLDQPIGFRARAAISKNHLMAGLCELAHDLRAKSPAAACDQHAS